MLKIDVAERGPIASLRDRHLVSIPCKALPGCPSFEGHQISIIPRFRPMVTAWVRSFAPSFARMFLTWPLTVSSGDPQQGRNLFVGIPAGDQPQYFDFPRG